MKDLLISELKTRFNLSLENIKHIGDLLYLPDFSKNDFQKLPYWSRTAMLEPFEVQFDSIGDAANALRSVQRSWAPYQFSFFRRANLIQEKLPHVNLKDKLFFKDNAFALKIPESPIGLYTLIDEHTMIASAVTSSFLPAGKLSFVEDHENPPSRAYLKIQESLAVFAQHFKCDVPKAGERCFEAGACPGGWTWVLVNLGANVFAVDRSELVPSLMENPLVEFRAHDAFTYKPEELGKFDWIFSDVICYPERLLEWIKMWLASGNVKNMICTIKMQGSINWDLIKEFEAIPNSHILHLNYNKHELTWMHQE